MKTAKTVPVDLTSSRRAQPLRQTRNNPPRSSISGARNVGSRPSLGGAIDEAPIEIFPAITHFADAITALPKEIVRHFTLLKEVDAKIFAPEEDLTKLVEAALNAPLPQRSQAYDTQSALGPTSAPMSAQGSLNGSIINGHPGSITSGLESDPVYDAANIPRRQLFKHCAYTMQNMLVSLDEKNHVISTAGEALSKQLARIDDCFPFIELEFSEEARYGSTAHWAYPENRLPKTSNVSRRELASANQLSAAAQHMADEAAARSDARKQALLDRKKSKNQHIESDFDDNHDRNKEKKPGKSKVRKAAEAAPSVGLGITNGSTANGNPPKRRKVEKTPAGGAVMERSMSAVFGNNAAATKAKVASPRATPQPEGSKKRSRAPAALNGATRKRNNTITSIAMSPSIASSPIQPTFLEAKATPKISSPPPPPPPPSTANGRSAPIRARQNSTQSNVEKRPASASSVKPNIASTPETVGAAAVPARSIVETKISIKETGPIEQLEHVLKDIEKDVSATIDGVVGDGRMDIDPKQEEPETNGNPIPVMQTTQVVTTKSGRASKPSTPALSSTFPEPVRARSSRGNLEGTSSNKRSHKKGAGAAAQLLASQSMEVDETPTKEPEDEDEDAEIDADEPRYCYCNNVSYGEMVGCDANDCEREWFHLACVGLKTAPKSNAKWYCEDCKERLKNKRFNGR